MVIGVGDSTAMSSLGRTGPLRSRSMAWPVVSGQIPPLAVAAVARQETGLSLATSLPPGPTTVLPPDAELAGRRLGALGGPGSRPARGAAGGVQPPRGARLLGVVPARRPRSADRRR